MKIIHTADLHLDSRVDGSLSPALAKERRLEVLETFQRMVAYAAEEGVSAILIAGDLFDKPHIRKGVRLSVLDEIRSHPEIGFLVLKGNHEKTDFLNDLEDGECPENLMLFKEEAWTAYQYGNIVISGRELTDKSYKTISVNLILDESKFNIVVLHGQQPGYVGKDPTHIVQIPQFRNKFIDYLALGHIHSYSEGRLDDRGEYCYSGCPEGRNFKECGEKGFVLLDIDEKTGTFSHTFVPFAKRKLCEIEVPLNEHMDMEEIEKSISQALEGMQHDDLIKVVLTGHKEMDFDIDVEKINKIYSDRFYFFKVWDKTEVLIDYDSFVGDRSLKGEFVRLMQREEMPEEERARIIELGMKALLGEEL